MLNIEQSLDAIEKAESIHDLLHNIKPLTMGAGSLCENLGKQIKAAPQEQKKEIGKQLSELRPAIESAINKKLANLEDHEINIKLLTEKIDGSLPSRITENGLLHPITIVANEMIDIFKIYGFELNSGFEIEDDWHNFTALNIPEHHPARQMHDTFYMNDKKMVLRTHTTSVDIRALIKKGAPIKAISFGKTFRCDSDKTHSPMFHQFELLQVGENLSMADLKGHILSFLRAFFGKNNIEIRLRPSFFPFTEPSAEVDIGYCIRDGKIIVGEETEKFMEILGCGMLHPNVLENCKIDSKKYNGIALGMGVERMAMLKYGINDLRKFFESDLKWLKQNALSNI
jgi:phenylalanyl-tRNA synthetase alpha chain